ncbi:9780_t:CDS:2 [Paraglomus brasilianum]|uniref:9780_t:CDS:1 n=1 Tax=Paraglomus brasilianum TaxID=144538 RepID=A0A9N9CJY4_9GLOM|nr:9780_t:CDS:2 [Paraglomus brasilianum]
MDKSYYAGLAKEYIVELDWTVRGYLDFVKSKHPDVGSTDRHMVEAALKGRLRAIAGKGKGIKKRSKASSVLADFKDILKSRVVASFWEAQDEMHDKHSALTTIRQEGIKTAVAAIQNQAEILRAALQSSSDKVCCNNAPSSKQRIDQDEDGTHKHIHAEGIPALEDAEEVDGFYQLRTSLPMPLSLSLHNETFTSPQKLMLHKDTLHYLHKHVKIGINEQCIILRHGEGDQCAAMARVLHSWLVNVLLSEKENFKNAIMTPLEPVASTSHNQFRRVCEIILYDFFSMTSEAILDQNIGKRKYMIERIVPLFKAIQSVYKEYAFDWIETEVTSIKDAKADGIGVKLGSNKEHIFIEVAGGPENTTEKHANDNAEKLIKEAIFGLVSLLQDYLNKSAEAVRDVGTFIVQVIGDQMTLSKLCLDGKHSYSLSQIKSATIPFCFDEVKKYMEVFELLYTLVSALENQAHRLKRLRLTSFTGDAPMVHEWLWVPNSIAV